MADTRVIAIVCGTLVNYGFALKSYDNPDCIIDTSLPAKTLGNYVDCTSDVMVGMGKTECCQIDKDKGCCKPGGQLDQYKDIWLGIGITTFVLAAFLVYCLWCRKTKNKHLLRCMACTKARYFKVEEKCPCCKERVYNRKQMDAIREAAKDAPVLELPKDSDDKNVVVDTFWDGQMVTNA